MAKRGRPKGSKNKTNGMTINMAIIADRFAAIFIAQHHLDGAEKLTQSILEKIRAQKQIRKEKHGEK